MMATYYVDAGYIEPEYDYDGYLWSAGYQLAAEVEAETRGQAKSMFIIDANTVGHDLKWTDKISVKLVKK